MSIYSFGRLSSTFALLAVLCSSLTVSAQDDTRSDQIRTATIELFEAVENHDVEAARTALDNGADVNGVLEGPEPRGPTRSTPHRLLGARSDTPLTLALQRSESGQEEVDALVKLLVRWGAALNFYPENGVSPMVQVREQSKHLSYLLAHGGDPNASFTLSGPPSSKERTLLQWAVGCCPETARLILDYGAEPDQWMDVPGHGFTADRRPLYVALRRASEKDNTDEYLTLAETLLRYGHSPGIVEMEDREPGVTTQTTAFELVDQTVPSSEKQQWLDLVEQARHRDLDYTGSDAPVLVMGVDASSTLRDDEDPYRYSAANAFDRDPATAWVENAGGGGGVERPEDPSESDGEYLTLTFNQTVTFDAVEVLPGYFKKDVWSLNNRVRSLGLWGHVLEEGTSNDPKSVYIGSTEFEDRQEGQRYEFDSVQEVEILTFEIRSVYEGERWDDTPISEIALYRNGERIELTGNLADADSPVVISQEEWK